MTQVKLSYEEQILNALNRVKGIKGESNMDRQTRNFNAIREVLRPLYDNVKDLENKASVTLAKEMAIRYAAKLSERLASLEISRGAKHDDTSVSHLEWMCQEICSHIGHVPQEWSITKLHRWIGYIQGVMVARGLTTVIRERDDYRTMKEQLLKEMNL